MLALASCTRSYDVDFANPCQVALKLVPFETRDPIAGHELRDPFDVPAESTVHVERAFAGVGPRALLEAKSGDFVTVSVSDVEDDSYALPLALCP
jgi:hypothetical protein